MRHGKHIFAAAAALVLTVGAGAAGFSKTKSYANNFTDVAPDAWYAAVVADAYEFGILNGDSDTTFNPDGTLTVAEGVTIASRLHAALTDRAIPEKTGGNWYDRYVDYAFANGLADADTFEDFETPIFRHEIASLLAAATGEMPVINTVSSLPDVAKGAPFAPAVFKLCQAGILTGNDAYGTFAPYSYLLRSEIAAMSVRIADENARVRKDFPATGARAFTDAYAVIDNPWNALGGWDYDNRFDLLNFTGEKKSTLTDASDEEFYAFRRSFAPENEGLLRLEIAGNFRSNDGGVYLALEDAKENRVVEITAKGGEWVLAGVDGTSTGVAVSADLAAYYTFVFAVDLDENTASVIVNNRESGKVSIAPDASLCRLVIGTNKTGKGMIEKDHVMLWKNAVLNETFLAGEGQSGEQPASWKTTGDFVISRMGASVYGKDVYSLKADSKAGSVSTVEKTYTPVTGKVALEAYILLPEKTDGAAVAFTSGGRDALRVETRGGKFCVGDTVLHDYIPNVWQWLYAEADLLAGSVTVKINGKTRATLPLDVITLDGVRVTFAPTTDGAMWVDDLKVTPLTDHADYPAYPAVASSDGYNVGLNLCCLWRDLQSGEGWDAMSAFPEFDTYLGFYDEGLPETADREIKLMAEHGIDFAHVCWYTPSYNTYNQSTPIKKSRFSHAALHDGYMNARYSDLIKFCIMWENSWQDVSSLEQFKAYIWNYWKEYYLSDDRYLRLDNKALITVWDRTALMKAFGGTTQALKDGIAFMNEDIKTLGYDGVILLCQTQGANGGGFYEGLEAMGLDGAYAYHWGPKGYDAAYQIECNETNAASAASHALFVPTVSNGFNCVGRSHVRYPVITGADHLAVAENIKAILASRHTGSWQDNTLIVSTWNEYSEGTYVMPTRGTGFDYLENIRKTFTSDTSDHTEADKPLTASQKARIGHLYPPHRSPVRRLRLEKTEAESAVFSPDDLVAVRTYDMAKGGAGYFSPEFGIDGWDTGRGVIAGSSSQGDFCLHAIAPAFTPLKAEDVSYIHLRMKSSVKDEFEVFFMTNTASAWSGMRRFVGTHTAAGTFDDYYIRVAGHSEWKDTVTGIRIDPITAPGSFEIALVEFLTEKPTPDTTPKLEVNGTLLDLSFAPAYTPDGDIAVAAEVSKGFFSALRVFHTFDRFDGVLTLQTRDERTLAFTVGRDTVAVDGAERPLGYTFTLRDGLPVFHMKKLASLLGYPVKTEGLVTSVRSCTDAEFEKIMARKPDRFEFDFAGDVEGFVPQLGKIDAVDGKLVFVPTGADVAVFKLVNLNASDYTHVVMGIEYSEALAGETPQLFFTTSREPRYGWKAENCINGRYDLDGKKPGDIVEVRFKLSENAAFTGTITGLRFDPIGTQNVFKIDYIRCIYDDSLDYTGLSPVEELSYEFDKDGAAGAWIGQNCEVSVIDGTLNGLCTADDVAVVNFALNIPADMAQVVVVGVKYDPAFCHEQADLFFSTDKSPGFSANKCVHANYFVPDGTKEGDTVEILFDLTTNRYFKSTVKSLRFDVHGGRYPFAVDYIRLYDKDGYLPPDDNIPVNTLTGPTSVTVTDAANLPEGVTVKADGAGRLEITDDPDDPGKKVFRIACGTAGDYYTYFRLFMQFEAGKTYSVSYQIYPLKNMNGADYTTTIGGNIAYGSDGETADSHLFDFGATKVSGSGWQSVDTTVAVDSDYNPTDLDRLELWGRPFEGAGVEYLVKDIVVKPVS